METAIVRNHCNKQFYKSTCSLSCYRCLICYTLNIRYVVYDVKRKQIENLEFNARLSLSFTDVSIIILKLCPCFILTSYLYI